MPTITEILAFFNLFAGLMLSISIIVFLGGFVLYVARIGTWPTYREVAVRIMRWGVTILFALVVILGLQQALLAHLMVAAVIGALIIIGLLVWALVSGSEEAPKPPARRGE